MFRNPRITSPHAFHLIKIHIPILGKYTGTTIAVMIGES